MACMDTVKKRSLEDMKHESLGHGGESMEIDEKEGCARRELKTLLQRRSPFANHSGALPIGEFAPSPILSNAAASDFLESKLTKSKVLVVGAGGLGCGTSIRWYDD